MHLQGDRFCFFVSCDTYLLPALTFITIFYDIPSVGRPLFLGSGLWFGLFLFYFCCMEAVHEVYTPFWLLLSSLLLRATL